MAFFMFLILMLLMLLMLMLYGGIVVLLLVVVLFGLLHIIKIVLGYCGVRVMDCCALNVVW